MRPDLRVEGAVTRRRLEIRLPLEHDPRAVVIDGSAFEGWRYDAAARKLVVAVEAADVAVSVQP
jgi:hypothetical protein